MRTGIMIMIMAMLLLAACANTGNETIKIGTYTFLPNGDVEGIGFVTTRIENGEPVHT